MFFALGDGLLINTPLQWGGRGRASSPNRFNGFPRFEKTVETVLSLSARYGTPLKRGVNESAALGPHPRVKYPG
jgi:hypothetical protein